MNIDSATNYSANLDRVNAPSEAPKATVASSYTQELETLNILAQQALEAQSPQFYQVVCSLNQKEIDYSLCKHLFIQAYIEDYSPEEQRFYMNHFLQHFDPKKNLLSFSSLKNTEAQKVWEGVIRYLCENYLGFTAQPNTLSSTFFSLLDTNALKSHLNETQLEESFDQGMDFLLDLESKYPSKEESKIFLTSYLARLIAQLSSYESCENIDSLEDLNTSIQDLFEEVYFYLLHYSDSPVFLNVNPNASLKEDFNIQQTKQAFIQALIKHLKNNPELRLQENQSLIIEKVFKRCSFLNHV